MIFFGLNLLFDLFFFVFYFQSSGFWVVFFVCLISEWWKEYSEVWTIY
jgi:hypothetical protein